MENFEKISKNAYIYCLAQCTIKIRLFCTTPAPFNLYTPNPVYHLQELLGAHHILHVFRTRVKLRFFSKSQKNIM